MDFEELYRSRLDAIYAMAFRLLRDPEQAQDATQEAFLRAWRGWGRFRGEADPGTWLYRIAYNVCLDRLSRRPPEAVELEPEERPDRVASRPEPAAEAAEAAALVRRGMAALSEEDRRVLALLLDQGADYALIAGALGCSVEAVRMRASRARRRLREALEPVLKETI